MKKLNRDLLVLLKNQFMTEQAIEQEVVCLNEILVNAESFDSFCIAHELVNRNIITNNRKKILKAIRKKELKRFIFLINRN